MYDIDAFEIRPLPLLDRGVGVDDLMISSEKLEIQIFVVRPETELLRMSYINFTYYNEQIMI